MANSIISSPAPPYATEIKMGANSNTTIAEELTSLDNKTIESMSGSIYDTTQNSHISTFINKIGYDAINNKLLLNVDGGADTVIPFEGETIHTETFSATSRSASIDMGEKHKKRYVNTNEVPNSNSGTYTASSRSDALDMGATNTYRYVKTSGVPNSNSGTYSATSRSSSLDMGATNSYRYVNTSNVPPPATLVIKLQAFAQAGTDNGMAYLNLPNSYKSVAVSCTISDRVQVYGSNNNSSWTDLGRGSKSYNISSYNYVRFWVWSNSGTSNTATITFSSPK